MIRFPWDAPSPMPTTTIADELRAITAHHDANRARIRAEHAVKLADGMRALDDERAQRLRALDAEHARGLALIEQEAQR